MSNQKIFNYQFSSKNNHDNYFVNLTNQKAYDLTILDDFNQNIFLFGPKKSGKSYLANLWKDKNNNNLYDIYLYHNNQKYFLSKISIENYSFDKLFGIILLKTINKWKEINQINTSINNKLECKFKINNINELRYVRNLLKSNILVQNLTLKSIELNNNLYSILFVGDIENFKNSLELNRLNLFYENDLCNIELV